MRDTILPAGCALLLCVAVACDSGSDEDDGASGSGASGSGAVAGDGGTQPGGGSGAGRGGRGGSGGSAGRGRAGSGGSTQGQAGRNGTDGGMPDSGEAGSQGGSGSGGRAGTAAGSGGQSGGGSGNGGAAGDVEDPDPPEGTVPVMVGAGSGFRTSVSYDQGMTWTHDQPIPSGGIDCAVEDCTDHASNPLGLTYGNGWFFVEFGNANKNPHVLRSRDGLDWTQIYGELTLGLAYGNGRLVGGQNPVHYSDDDGETWHRGPEFDTRAGADNVRRVYFVPYDGGRFLMMVAGPSAYDQLWSRDGLTFTSAETFPAECAMNAIAYANGVIVGSAKQGRVCVSTDGGVNWVAKNLNGSDIRTVFRTDDEFIAYSFGKGYASPDGDEWTEFTPTPQEPDIWPTGRWPDGNVVAYTAGSNARFLYSADGRNWTNANAGAKSYGMNHFVFGYANSQ